MSHQLLKILKVFPEVNLTLPNQQTIDLAEIHATVPYAGYNTPYVHHSGTWYKVVNIIAPFKDPVKVYIYARKLDLTLNY